MADETAVIVGVLVAIVVCVIAIVIAGFWIYLCCGQHRDLIWRRYESAPMYPQRPLRVTVDGEGTVTIDDTGDSIFQDEVSIQPSIAPIARKPTVRKHKLFASQPNLGFHQNLSQSLGRMMESEPASHYQLSLDENDELFIHQGMFEIHLEEYDAEPYSFGEKAKRSTQQTPSEMPKQNENEGIQKTINGSPLLSSSPIPTEVIAPIQSKENDCDSQEHASELEQHIISEKDIAMEKVEYIEAEMSGIAQEIQHSTVQGNSDEDDTHQNSSLNPSSKTSLSSSGSNEKDQATGEKLTDDEISDHEQLNRNEPTETLEIKQESSSPFEFTSQSLPALTDLNGELHHNKQELSSSLSKLETSKNLQISTARYDPLEYPKQRVLQSGIEISGSESSLDESSSTIDSEQRKVDQEVKAESPKLRPEQTHSQRVSSLATTSYKKESVPPSSSSTSFSDNESETEIVTPSEAQTLEPKQAVLVKTTLPDNAVINQVAPTNDQPVVRRRKLTPAVQNPQLVMQHLLLPDSMGGSHQAGKTDVFLGAIPEESSEFKEEDEEMEDTSETEVQTLF